MQEIPSGHVVEISGPHSSGKSELLLPLIARTVLSPPLGLSHHLLFLDLDLRLDLDRLRQRMWDLTASLPPAHPEEEEGEDEEGRREERRRREVEEGMERVHVVHCCLMSDLAMTLHGMSRFIERHYSSSSSSLSRFSTLIIDGLSSLRFSDIYHSSLSKIISAPAPVSPLPISPSPLSPRSRSRPRD